jgi:hypothetical protein
VYLTPSSGRAYVFLLKTTCFYTAIIYGTFTDSSQIKHTTLLVYNILKWLKSYVLHAVLCVANLENMDDVTEETSNI